MDSPSLLRPQLRPTSCGERVAFCCVLVGMGMCGRENKLSSGWLTLRVKRRLFWSSVCVSLCYSLSPPPCAAEISFRLTLLSSLAHSCCVMLGAGCPGLQGQPRMFEVWCGQAGLEASLFRDSLLSCPACFASWALGLLAWQAPRSLTSSLPGSMG